eukprot:SAG31_NODE_11326_length_1042_cov_0.958643_2_plen_228_part_00
MPAAPARTAAEMLADLGFGTALDLDLLGGGEAATKVLEELKAARVRAADRAKVRLLVGDREHLWRLQSSSSPLSAAAASAEGWAGSGSTGPASTGKRPANSKDASDFDVGQSNDWRRKLQGDGSASGMSVESIAIVLSVLIGGAGYILQAFSSQRANAAAAARAQQHSVSETRRQREHEQVCKTRCNLCPGVFVAPPRNLSRRQPSGCRWSRPPTRGFVAILRWLSG